VEDRSHSRAPLLLETFAVGPLACNCTIVADEATHEAIVVDGGDGVDEVVHRLKKHNLTATLLIHTHAHIDHIGDLGRLRELTAARGLLHHDDLPLYRTLPLQARWIGLSHAPAVVPLDGDLREGDVLHAGGMRVGVLHTPGHTPGSVCFAVSNGDSTTLLTGDTLFAGSIGRWDLGGTSMEEIVHSIHTKLMDFADATPVIPGHGPFTTIGTERATNPYLA
jgi:hydroxyacylglutathione hydrolase